MNVLTIPDANERCFLHADLVERLHSEFPYDNGILMVYFLNYLRLKPSEALFLGANEPHAYLFGGKILEIFSRAVLSFFSRDMEERFYFSANIKFLKSFWSRYFSNGLGNYVNK